MRARCPFQDEPFRGRRQLRKIPITEADIVTVVPNDPTSTGPKGRLKYIVLNILLRIIYVARNNHDRKLSTVIANSFITDKLGTETSKASAKKAGLE